MRVKILLIFSMLLCSGMMYAQRTITGSVTDEYGEPLIGADVVVQGAAGIGAATDIDGTFSIEVPDGSTVLVFSYVGYKAEEVVLGTSNVVNLSLQPDVEVFDEIVVTGYSTELKRDVTSSITSVKAEEIEGLPVQSFDRAIQGKVSGVAIGATSGAPGGAVEIRVRGVGSIGAGNDPLIIIDGVQVSSLGQSTLGSSNALNSINPNDIESIEILKDAASTAIYGAQGANGVVVVTTKSGNRNEKAKFNLSYQAGIVEPMNLYEVMNNQQYADIRTAAILNNGESLQTARDLVGDPSDPNLASEDWVDVLWQTGSLQTADLSFSGGSKKADYYGGVSYNQTESQIITNEWQRITAKFNLNADLTDKLKVGLRTALTYSQQDGQPCDGGFFVNCPFAPSFWSMPISPALDENGDYNPYPLNGSGHNFSFNQLQNAENVTRLGQTLQNVASINLSYALKPNLTITGLTGIDYTNNDDKQVRPISIPFFAGQGGQVVDTDRVSFSFNSNVVANYSFELGEDHDFAVLGGVEYVQNNFNNFRAIGRGFADAFFVNLNSASTPFAVSGTSTTSRRQSVFGQVKYDYQDKYIFSGTVRREGSSRFGSNSKYGTFYAVSGAWRIGAESFLQDVSWLEELKIRASFGTAGNSAIGDFSSLEVFGTRGQYLGAPGLANTTLANDLLAWEEAQQLDIGLDFALFDNRVYGSIDVWQKDNKNLLLATQIPATSGIANSSITENVGSVRNSGVDIELNTVLVNKGGFKWSVGGTVSFTQNEITSLTGDRDTIFSGGFPQLVVGRPIGIYNLLDYAGINPANGRAMAYDKDGNLTYNPSVEDVSIFDEVFPTIFGGIRTEFSYKGIGLLAFFQYSGGNSVLNNDLYALASASSDNDNQLVDQAQYWRNPGDITTVGIPVNGGVINGINQLDFGIQDTDRFVSDASYMRLKELKVSYTLPRSVLSKLGLGNVTVFAQGLNLITWTKFDGIDPEVVSNRSAFGGGGQGGGFAFPLGRQFGGGINVTF